MNIGRNLTMAMYDKKVSARELANKVGVCEAHISKIKKNERIPSLPVAEKLAKELGITVDKLINQKGEKRNDRL